MITTLLTVGLLYMPTTPDLSRHAQCREVEVLAALAMEARQWSVPETDAHFELTTERNLGYAAYIIDAAYQWPVVNDEARRAYVDRFAFAAYVECMEGWQ